MTDGFALHGITHLSASSINAYATDLGLWCMERLMKMKTQVGCAAHRGTAIEAGVSAGLLDPSLPIEVAQAIAIQEYAKLTAFSSDPKREQEREAVEPSVAVAIDELRKYGIPDMVQYKIEKRLPDVSIPLIGYIDFGWSQHGIILDLKTALKLSSTIANGHARQVAGYIYETNFEGRVCYTTPKKLAVYQLTDAERRINEVVQIAHRMNKFLSLSSDAKELTSIIVPNYDHFFWNNSVTRENGRLLYGF